MAKPDKKAEKVKDEVKTHDDVVKTPSEETKEKAESTIIDMANSLKKGIEELKTFDPDHHNKGVIDIAIEDAIRAVVQVVSQLEFVEKAKNEKKK
jgi:hypothetical protein